MQKASVGSRPPQNVSDARRLTRADLTVFPGGSRTLPRPFLDLLYFLVSLISLRRRVGIVVEEPPKDAEPVGMFDDVPDTGVREVRIPRGLAKCSTEIPPEPPPEVDNTFDGIDEILGLNKTEVELEDVEIPDNLFIVNGIRLKRVSSHALGQYIRAFCKEKGRLGRFIDKQVKGRMSRLMFESLDAAGLRYYRRLERRGLADDLLDLLRREARRLKENQERMSSGHTILHVPRGPKNSFFVFVDERSGVILRFYSAQGYNRRKAYRKVIWRNTRRRH